MTAVRTLLTVVVAAALLGASLPAVDDARTTRTDARLDTTAIRVTDVAVALVADDDPVPTDEHGASRTVVVTVPSGGFATARADYLSLGGLPNDSQPTIVGSRVAGQPPRRVDSGVRFVTGDGPLVLPPGRHTLRLTLVRTPEGAGVRVRVAGRGTPTGAKNTSGPVRTFKYGNGSSASHTDDSAHNHREPLAGAVRSRG